MAEAPELDNVATLEPEMSRNTEPVTANSHDAAKPLGSVTARAETILHRAPSIARLNANQMRLLLALGAIGDRIKAAAEVYGYDLSKPEEQEKARLAAFAFDKGALVDVIDEINGVSVYDKILIEISKAARSRKLMRSRVRALAELAQLAGLIERGRSGTESTEP